MLTFGKQKITPRWPQIVTWRRPEMKKYQRLFKNMQSWLDADEKDAPKTILEEKKVILEGNKKKERC